MPKTFVIMPIYHPAPGFYDLVHALCDRGYTLIIVDDREGEAREIPLADIDARATVVDHEKNLGKGVTIRTGYAYVQDQFVRAGRDLEESPDLVAIMSGDRSYTPEDLENMLAAAALPENARKLTLGVRVFNDKTPFLSRIGTIVTRTIFRMLVRANVSDTMTGLRVCSVAYIPDLLELEGDQSEYEMNQLTYFARRSEGFCEVPVQDGLPRHVEKRHVIRNSLRVYLGLFKFASSSFTSFLLDFACFCLFSALLKQRYPDVGDLIANVLARIISSTLNYNLNCRLVFRRKPSLKSATQFALLAAGILVVNSGVLYLWKLTPLPTQICKLFTEMCMFVVNYIVQQKVIFRKKKKGKKDPS